jgi:hypothetical protein
VACRRSHYELAFEAYLSERRTPYVAVEEMKRAVPGRPGIKLFDYIVYGESGTNYLVDVKGRKVPGRTRSRESGLETWVTAADVSGLTEWQSVFGAGFAAAFVFAHWRTGLAVGESDGRFDFAGRSYTFRVIDLADYQRHQRQRSPRWRTVCLPRESYRRLSRRPEDVWGKADDRHCTRNAGDL